MPLYQFEAVTSEGAPTIGNLFANSKAEAVEMLSKRGVVPIRLKSPTAWFPQWRGVSLAQQVTWYSMLADLLSAGMPIAESLELLMERTTNPMLAEATRDIRSRVIQGESLSQSMQHHPQVFDDLAQCLVAAGEEGAFLDKVLDRIATIKESKAKILSRLTSAFAYPAFLLVVGALVLASMMMFFVPRFEPLFQRMRETQGLPWATEWLFATNHFLIENWLLSAFVALGILGLVSSWLINPGNHVKRDGYLLSNPLLGPLVSGITLSRFCHILGSLLSSGIRIQQATYIAGQTSGNKAVSAAAARAVERITAGVGLAEALQGNSEFPREIVELIRMGEKTNRLEHVLQTTSQRLDARSQQTLDILLRLIEPLLMVFMAGLIGFVMIALLMPIFTASGQTFQ